MAGTSDAPVTPEIIYCKNHPHTETLVRCSRCLEPICVKCGIPTPVGLRCAQCARIGRSPLYQLQAQHIALASVVALVLGIIAGGTVARLGLLFAFILSAPVGGLIGEAMIRLTHKRGRTLQIIAVAGIVVGTLVGPFVAAAVLQGSLAALPANPLVYLGSLFNLSAILYTVLAAGAAIARLH
jgi:hypothetical protein